MEDMAPFTDDFARNLYVFSWINTMAMLNSQIYIYIYYIHIYLEPSFDPSLGWLTFNFMGQNLDIPWVKTGFQRTVAYIAWRWRTVDVFSRVIKGTSKAGGIIESWLAVHIYIYNVCIVSFGIYINLKLER